MTILGCLLIGVLYCQLSFSLGKNATGCLKKSTRCFANQGFAQVHTFYRINRVLLGERWTFDCSEARNLCQEENKSCRYSVQWHRFAGCESTKVAPLERYGRKDNYKLTLKKVGDADLGLWGCELLSIDERRYRSVLTSTGIFKVFLLHVISPRNPEGVLSCGKDQRMPPVGCPLGDICYANQVKSRYLTTNAERGCWPLRSVPPTLFSNLISSPQKSCIQHRSSTSCPSTELEMERKEWRGGGIVCCFCFAAECNKREIDLRNSTWSSFSSLKEDWSIRRSACQEIDHQARGGQGEDGSPKLLLEDVEAEEMYEARNSLPNLISRARLVIVIAIMLLGIDVIVFQSFE